MLRLNLDKKKNQKIAAANLRKLQVEDLPQSVEKRKIKRKRNAFIFKAVFILIVVAVVYAVGSFLWQNGFTLPNNQPVSLSFTPNNTICDISYKNAYYFSTIDGLKSVNSDGKDVNADQNAIISPMIRGMKEPIAQKSEKSVLVYDIAGKSAVLFNENGIISPFNFDKDIIKAKMNNKGRFVVILNEDGAKAAVKAYDAGGNELLTWYSGDGYVVDAMISETKNMMAVVTNELADGSLNSKIWFFELDLPDPVNGCIVSESLCSYVSYYGNGALVLCDDAIYYVTESGEITKASDFADKKVVKFKTFPNGDFLICSENSDNETYTIDIYSAKGKKIKKFTTEAFTEICDIQVDKFLVIRHKEVASYNRNGRILKTADSDYEIRDAIYFKDRLVLVGNDRIVLN